MKIVIAADSTCDLSPELIKENDIKIVPLYVNIGERSLKDGIDIVPSDIFDYVDKTGSLPKTSAVPIGEFSDIFEELKKDADADNFINMLYKKTRLEDTFGVNILAISKGFPTRPTGCCIASAPSYTL